MKKRILGLGVLLGLGSLVFGQDSTISGVYSGMVFDPVERSLRLVNGVPGGAYLGGSLSGDLDFAAVAPNGTTAVAFRGGTAYLIPAPSAPWKAVAGEQATPSLAAWSEDSRSVALSIGSSIVMMKDGEWLPLGELASPAISLAIFGDSVYAGRDGEVLRLSSGSAPRAVAAVAEPSALAIAKDVLYVADRSRGDILAVSSLDSAPETRLLASESLSVPDPAALALSADGRTLLVAGGKSKLFAALDASSGVMASVTELDFEPSVIQRMASSGSGQLILLNHRSEAQPSLQVFDISRNAIFFVPASSVEE